MSVTAAQGFRRERRPRGHPPNKASTSRSCARPARDRRGDVHRNRVQAAPVVVSREHLELAEPQAVVVNSGVANAATGERGELDARATAAETARLLELDAEEVLVLSTGVIGAPLPLAQAPRRARAPPRRRSPAEGGDDAAEAIMTTDTHAEAGGRRAATASRSAAWRRARG